jgi:hypothetical protein
MSYMIFYYQPFPQGAVSSDYEVSIAYMWHWGHVLSFCGIYKFGGNNSMSNIIIVRVGLLAFIVGLLIPAKSHLLTIYGSVIW